MTNNKFFTIEERIAYYEDQIKRAQQRLTDLRIQLAHDKGIKENFVRKAQELAADAFSGQPPKYTRQPLRKAR